MVERKEKPFQFSLELPALLLPPVSKGVLQAVFFVFAFGTHLLS